MNQTDLPLSSTPSVPPQEIYPRHVDETKKASFWISQVFILLATIIGVYLASSQGFKQALAYGEVQSARSNYYLRQSLRNEIADNLLIVEGYMERLGTGAPSARETPLNLDVFVWECLKTSSNTLETPSELLRGSRAFYRGIAETHEKIANQTYAIGYGREQMQRLVDQVKKEVLPAFDKDLAALRQSLAKSGIAVK